MRESTFFKVLFVSFAFVALTCVPEPAFAQRGGHGGGGGGGFYGGGGHFSGGGGFRGGGPSGRSSMGRGAAPRIGGGQGGFAGRPSGAPSFNGRYFQGGRGSAARPPIGSHPDAGSMEARNSDPGSVGANHPTADGRWYSFADSRGATGSTGSARASGNAGSRNFAWAYGGPAGAGRTGAAAGSSNMRSSSPSRSSDARSSSISPGRAIFNMQGSRMNGSALAGSHTGTQISTGSTLGSSAFSRTGVNNSAFTSARLGSSMFGHSAITSSTFGHPFSGSGFNRSLGRGFFNDHDFDDFGFRCFGCGFGFNNFFFDRFFFFNRFGFFPPRDFFFFPRRNFFFFDFGFFPTFGFFRPPWWWDPWWGGAPPPPLALVSGDSSPYYGNSNSAYNEPYTNPSSGYDNSNSFSASLHSEPLGSPNTNSLTEKVADTTPTILLYLKDGTMLAASDYWIADNKLHYLVNYGSESTVEMDQVDLQRTVDENGKRGVKFWLKPNPNRTTGSPLQAPAPSQEPHVETTSEQHAD